MTTTLLLISSLYILLQSALHWGFFVASLSPRPSLLCSLVYTKTCSRFTLRVLAMFSLLLATFCQIWDAALSCFRHISNSTFLQHVLSNSASFPLSLLRIPSFSTTSKTLLCLCFTPIQILCLVDVSAWFFPSSHFFYSHHISYGKLHSSFLCQSKDPRPISHSMTTPPSNITASKQPASNLHLRRTTYST